MKIFVTSDTHFNHKNIIEYTKRPFKTVEEMNEEIIKRWNSKVGKEDIVLHLGDFALGNQKQIKEIREKLNGMIFLLVGNHDYNCKDAGFMVIEGRIKINKIIFSHAPMNKEEIPKGFVNVHGHIHEKESLNGINVSVEKTDFTPLSIEELKSII